MRTQYGPIVSVVKHFVEEADVTQKYRDPGDGRSLHERWASREAQQRAGREVVEATFPEPTDHDRAWQHFLRMMSYEGWIEAGRPDNDLHVLEEWPPTYHAFFDQWPDAFQYYRHHAFAYVSRAVEFMPWGPLLHSLVERLKSLDPSNYDRLRETLQDAGERFGRQRRQAMRALYFMPTPEDAIGRLDAALAAYGRLYETDLPLWFLGVVGRGLSQGRIDPTFLGGPATQAPQASLVDTVSEALVGTPLQQPFSFSYDPALRNAVAHNNHEVTEDETGEVVVVDHETGQRWTAEDAWTRVVATQHMHHAVLLAAQLALEGQLEPPTAFCDVGVLSFTLLGGEGLPVVLVPQLWCFRDIDPRGGWIDEATLRITVQRDGSSLLLSTNATSRGPGPRDELLEVLREENWVRVVRVPVAPSIGMDLPQLTTEQGEVLEVVGGIDEHIVPIEIGE